MIDLPPLTTTHNWVVCITVRFRHSARNYRVTVIWTNEIQCCEREHTHRPTQECERDVSSTLRLRQVNITCIAEPARICNQP